MIFKAVGDSRPYPEHGLASTRDWSSIPPRMVRLESLTTTRSTLNLHDLLAQDSTFYGDLFAPAVTLADDGFDVSPRLAAAISATMSATRRAACSTRSPPPSLPRRMAYWSATTPPRVRSRSRSVT